MGNYEIEIKNLDLKNKEQKQQLVLMIFLNIHVN